MRYLILVPVRIYQWTIAPLLPPACRYYPSCSNYMIQAVQRHGAFRGAWLGLARLLRCAPWGGYGYDPVPRNDGEASR